MGITNPNRAKLPADSSCKWCKRITWNPKGVCNDCATLVHHIARDPDAADTILRHVREAHQIASLKKLGA